MWVVTGGIPRIT